MEAGRGAVQKTVVILLPSTISNGGDAQWRYALIENQFVIVKVIAAPEQKNAQ